MKTAFINRTLAVVAALLFTSQVFAASDFLLHIEGVKGEGKGKTFELTEQADGSFTATNIPAGIYKLVYKPKVVVAGSNNLSGSSTFRKGKESVTFEAIVSPRDAASGLPTGKRQHKPITITKEWDKSTPQLLMGQIVVGDLDGDGAADRTKVNQTNPPENAGKLKSSSSSDSPVKAGYDLKLNKKV